MKNELEKIIKSYLHTKDKTENTIKDYIYTKI